ncbi:MAG: 7,8-didemethyl-8-hydroxy-5-deazariboflavin synthase subunit CofH [Desulfatiglandales bacterium]
MFPEVRASQEIRSILNTALDGQRLTVEEGVQLLRASSRDTMAIALTADEVRSSKVGEEVSYVVNRNINFTNICVGSCQFCAFRRREGEKGAYFLDIPQIVEKTQEARDLGATEICIQGGLHPEIDVHFYSDLISAVKDNGNSIHLHAFSPMEIHYMSKQSDMNIGETLKLLKKSGLDSMPGTAAEILDDGIRSRICPQKIKSDEWVSIVKEAHGHGIPTTATMLYGHVESPEQKLDHLSVLRSIQDETKGFTEFVPLSFIHYNTPLFKSGKSRPGATGMEDLRALSVARLFLDNFRNIQSSWVKLGRKLAQLMLNFGANDLGGTLMEENISKAAGREVGTMTKEALEQIILDAGKTPVQRDTLYRPVLEHKAENLKSLQKI